MIDKKSDLTAEGKNFLKWDFFQRPDVVADIVNPVADRIKKCLSNQPNFTIHALDMGTGTGIIVKHLKQKLNLPKNNFAPVLYYGIDCLGQLIKQNKKDDPSITWMRADNKNISFSDRFFDIVFMRGALHYEETYAKQEQVIKEAHRVLKPGGYFINWQFCFHTMAEVNLMNEIYKILPKVVRAQTISEFQKMHNKIFGNAFFLKNENSRQIDLTAELFRARYNFNDAQQRQICETISSIKSDKRPHFHTDGKTFEFSVPQKILLCQKQAATK